MGVHVRERPKGSGRWWVDVVKNKQRVRKYVGKGPEGKTAAKRAAIDIEHKLTIGGGDVSTVTRDATAKPTPTFSEAAEEWLRRYPALHAIRPGTLDGYRSFTEKHLVPFFGAMPITAVTTDRIEDFIEAKRAPGGSVRLKGKALADSSLRTGLLALGLILQRAVRMKLLTGNPMREVEWRGLPRRDEVTVDPFVTTELRAILQAAHRIDPDLATMLRLWAQTGMRAGEVCGLQRHDLDLSKGTALVRRTWSRCRLGPTKTGLVRTVSFLHPVADETADWRPGATPESRSVVAGLKALKLQSLDPEAFVFGSGATPLSSMELHRKWRRVLAAARVRYRPPEQLRHTFASTLLSRNAPLLYVQAQGGWRSASVLLRVYARWLPQDPVQASNGTQVAPAVMAVAQAKAEVAL